MKRARRPEWLIRGAASDEMISRYEDFRPHRFRKLAPRMKSLRFAAARQHFYSSTSGKAINDVEKRAIIRTTFFTRAYVLFFKPHSASEYPVQFPAHKARISTTFHVRESLCDRISNYFPRIYYLFITYSWRERERVFLSLDFLFSSYSTKNIAARAVKCQRANGLGHTLVGIFILKRFFFAKRREIGMKFSCGIFCSAGSSRYLISCEGGLAY